MPEAHIAMARIYGVNYRYSESISELRLAVQEEPDNALAWDMLSWALGYATPPQAAESEKAAREAIRINPALSYAQYHLGRALYLQGHFPEAMAAFDRCEEMAGNAAAANLGRSQALAAHGRYADAITTLLKNGASKSMINTYWLSSYYAGNDEKEKALSLLQKSLESGFRDFAALDANPAFNSLRNDPRFAALVAHAKATAPSSSK
jgi:tetratricopeptide (TPR) repeat protein